jgi:hypothetical protein
MMKEKNVFWSIDPDYLSWLFILIIDPCSKKTLKFYYSSGAVWPEWANFRSMGDCLLSAVFFQNYRSSQNFWATVFQSIDNMCIHFVKIWVGLHFGPFFTNSSGRPVQDPVLRLISFQPQNLTIFFGRNFPAKTPRNCFSILKLRH